MEKEKEREGRGREKKRGRREGGEKMRRRIIVGGMVIGLLLGCNNGAIEELENENKFLSSVSNLGKGFLDIFVTFGDMVSGAFGIKADTKKSDVGKYFTDIAGTIESVKTKLQNEVAKNGNYEKVRTVVDKFIKEKLDVIAAGAKKAASGAVGDAIGNAVQSQNAVPAEVDSVNKLVNGIKEIVEVVLKDKGSAEATKTNTTEQQSIGKLLGQGSSDGDEKQAAAASASIGAVSGADILRAIEKSGDVTSGGAIGSARSAADIAIATMSTADLNAAVNKDAVIAAGISLRAMAKGGKFAAKTGEAKSAHAINGAAASAVGKTLSTLIIAIRRTVDDGLKTINDALAAVNQGDMSAEKSEGATK